MLKVINEGSERAEIYIYGDIIDDDEGVRFSEWYENTDGYEWARKLKEQLKSVEGKDLTIYINSYGGSVAAGLTMAHMIERHKGHTTCIVDGYCCSIATQIFFSADECKMPENTYLMIHKPEAYEYGNADEMRNTANILDTIQEGLLLAYKKKAQENVTEEELTEMMNVETWLTGKQAAEKFQIEVIEKQEIVNCAGSREKLKDLKYNKLPKDLKFVNSIRIDSDYKRKIKIALARAKGALIR